MAKWIPAAKLEAASRRRRAPVWTPTANNIVLFRVNGQVHAVVNVCPHAGLPLDEGADFTGSILVCPFHGYTFNLQNGKNVDYADDTPLTKFPTRIEDGVIHIDVEPPGN